MGCKALAPPLLGSHDLAWQTGAFEWKRFLLERWSNRPRGGPWRLKALDRAAGDNENDNDPTFLTSRGRE